MDQRQAFLDAIIADPADDSLRLVYADWLDEHGDASDRDRARFIRLKLELEGLEDEPRREAINLECRRIAARHGDAWMCGFHTQQGKGYFEYCSRGFLGNISLDPQDLSDPALDALLAREPVTEFNFQGDGFSSTELASWKHLPRVRNLRATDRHTLQRLLASPMLVGLEVLYGNGRLRASETALLVSDPRFSGLRRLEIRFCDLSDRPLKKILRSGNFPHLTELDYSGNATTIAALEALAASPVSQRLTFLGLGTGGHSTLQPGLGRRAAELIASFPALQSVDLQGQNIGDDGAIILANSPHLSGLKTLGVSGNQLGLRGVQAILESPYLTQLEELDLTANPPGRAWAPAFAEATPRRLRRLDLEANHLDGSSIEALAESPALAGLRILCLGGNPFGDQGAIALAKSTHLKNLVVFGLWECGITDLGALVLADSPGLPRIDRHTHPGGALSLLDLCDDLSEEAARRMRERFGGL